MFAVPVIRLTAARRRDAEASIRLAQRRAWFADDGDAAGSDDTGNPPEGAGTKKSEITYTPEQQAHIDKLAKDQREQGRKAAQADLLKKFGAEKPEDIEAKLKKLADLEKAALTADEQRELELKTEREKRETAERERDSIRAERMAERRDAKIAAAVQKEGVTSPELFSAWADKFGGDLLKATMADDGTVDDKAVKALIDAARKAQPSLFKPTTPGSPSVSGGRAVAPGKDAEARARRTHGNIIRG